MSSETSSYDIKTLRGMRTRTKKKYVASDPARRECAKAHLYRRVLLDRKSKAHVSLEDIEAFFTEIVIKFVII
ncbi:MAG: hypothetical protein V8S98_10870 [Lachnospiraceae bacterium]